MVEAKKSVVTRKSVCHSAKHIRASGTSLLNHVMQAMEDRIVQLDSQIDEHSQMSRAEQMKTGEEQAKSRSCSDTSNVAGILHPMVFGNVPGLAI